MLLEAARELFLSQGFHGATTREITERAGISETSMYRYFGSKLGLFREALVTPFVESLEGFNAKWQASHAVLGNEILIPHYVEDLFDFFRRNRGLVVILWAASGQSGNELAASGIFDEANRLLTALGDC